MFLKIFTNVGYDVNLQIQLTQLSNDVVFVELHDGPFLNEFNVNCDLFNRAEYKENCLQTIKRIEYQGMYTKYKSV